MTRKPPEVLAVIPARSGSKGLPGKNVREVAGKPLLVWSIEQALAAASVTRVVVSTDSEEYGDLASGAGAQVVIRPEELATDETPLDAVVVSVLHALKDREDYEPRFVVTLQPTCPVRPPWLIDRCVEVLLSADWDVVLTARRNPITWHIDSAGHYRSRQRQRVGSALPNRQDFPRSAVDYPEDGSVFVARAHELLRSGDRRAGRVGICCTGQWSIDIDSEADLLTAEALLKSAKLRRELEAA